MVLNGVAEADKRRNDAGLLTRRLYFRYSTLGETFHGLCAAFR
jgi:hypothetical protein